MKYEIYLCDVWGDETDGYTVNDVMPTGKVVAGDSTDVESLCNALGLDNPRKMDVDFQTNELVYVDYDGKPYCELRGVA